MHGEPRGSKRHPTLGNYIVYERIYPPPAVCRVRFEDGTVDYLTGAEIDSHPGVLDALLDRVVITSSVQSGHWGIL